MALDVDQPDVAVRGNFNAVGGGDRYVVPCAQELAVFVEFDDRVRPAIEDPDVVILVHCDARGFAEVPTGGELSPVPDHLIGQRRACFELGRSGGNKQKQGQSKSHPLEAITNWAGSAAALEALLRFPGRSGRFRWQGLCQCLRSGCTCHARRAPRGLALSTEHAVSVKGLPIVPDQTALRRARSSHTLHDPVVIAWWRCASCCRSAC